MPSHPGQAPTDDNKDKNTAAEENKNRREKTVELYEERGELFHLFILAHS